VTLIDSSAWIEFFRGTDSPAHRRLRTLVSSGGELVTTEPVAMELRTGARDPRERRLISGTLAACRTVSVDNASDWDAAAAIYLTCRYAGAAPRQLIDCLIAAVAIRAEVPILTQDRDFELISEHTTLELAS